MRDAILACIAKNAPYFTPPALLEITVHPARVHDFGIPHGRSANEPVELEICNLRTGQPVNSLAVRRVADAFHRIPRGILEPLPNDEFLHYFEEVWQQAGPTPSQEFYELHAAAFNAVYFAKNLLKCLIGLSLAPSGWVNGRILADLGAGAAPLTLACNLLASPAHALLIDRCAQQLAIAKQTMTLAGLGDRTSQLQMQIPDQLQLGAEAMPVASYWCLESADNAERVLGGADRFFVIDTPETVERLCQSVLAERVVSAGLLQFSVRGKLAKVIEGAGGRLGYICGSSH